MTKVFKRFLAVFAIIALTLTLAGCGFKSKAQKLAENFEKGEEYSLADIKDKMGDPTSEVITLGSGVVVWVNGCDSLEEVQEKLDEGKTVEALVVTVLANKVTSIDYFEDYQGE